MQPPSIEELIEIYDYILLLRLVFSQESEVVLIDPEILQLAMHLTIYRSMPGL
jgi:hypothetical protein